MTDLLDITDDSNPLNIKKGNPGLKPSFTHNFRLFYNNYIEKHQRALMTFVNFSMTRNSISDMVTYDDKTGGRTTQPENINGNWNARGAFMFNTAIDSAGVWNINTFTTLAYTNAAGYLSLDGTSSLVFIDLSLYPRRLLWLRSVLRLMPHGMVAVMLGP